MKQYGETEGFTTYVLANNGWADLEIENILNRENEKENHNKLIETLNNISNRDKSVKIIKDDEER